MSLYSVLKNDPIFMSAIRRRTLAVKGIIKKTFGIRSLEASKYSQMVNTSLQNSELYRAGRFWSQYNKRHSWAIYGGGLTNLRDEYFNRSFSGPMPESRQVYDALLWLYYRHIQTIPGGAAFLEQHEDTEVGGINDQTIVDGRRLSLDFLQSVEECLIIQRYCNKPPKVIVELGAGYGRIAPIAQAMWPGVSYIILDLPEGLICAESWLTRTSSNTRGFGPDIDVDFDGIQLGLPHQIESIPDKSVDVFINIYSFAEMPRRSINNYFHHVDRITAGLLLSKQRKTEVNLVDNEIIDEYPIPEMWQELLMEDSSLYPSFFQALYRIVD